MKIEWASQAAVLVLAFRNRASGNRALQNRKSMFLPSTTVNKPGLHILINPSNLVIVCFHVSCFLLSSYHVLLSLLSCCRSTRVGRGGHFFDLDFRHGASAHPQIGLLSLRIFRVVIRHRALDGVLSQHRTM